MSAPFGLEILMPLSIQECLIKIEKRAEKAGDDKLRETFVDAVPLFASISTNDHQVIFGRRGTGKTHLLKYLEEQRRAEGDLTVYLDLRAIGSNGSIYNDREKSHAQRATPLLLDVLTALHDALLQSALDAENGLDLSQLGPSLDAFADAISTVEVVGPVEVVETEKASREQAASASFGIGLSSGTVTGNASATASGKDVNETGGTFKRTGDQQYYVRFGTVQSAINRIVSAIGRRRVLILLDEWSEVPLDLQPYLADLLRRCVLPTPEITVKIAAIEHRSNFMIRKQGEYIGIELGADAGADVNLDDFMVFDNDAEKAKSFFANILFKHYRATEGLAEGDGAQSPEQLVNQTFTQTPAFEEFVRAVEGVPRDAVYLIATVVRRAHNRAITMADVRAAARDWFQRDKSTPLKSDTMLADLLHWIVDEVIAHRKARAFLLPAHQRHPLIDSLFDYRLLHVLKRNISSNETPGIRYDVYKLDFGCYVDLITTSKAPQSLLPIDEDAEPADVPPDDYRSIRRAILNIEDFEKRYAPTGIAY